MNALFPFPIPDPAYGYGWGMAAAASHHEHRSKALFGNKDMLVLCDGIARSSGRFTALEMSAAAGIGYSTAHRLLASLAKAGLVERVPRSSGEREQWYVRLRHRFWDAARDLRQDPGTSPMEAAQ
jgi:DNA-binding MarR family transcriptional regulator